MTGSPGGYPQYDLPELEGIARRVLEERLPEGITIPIDIDFLVDTEPGCVLELVPDLWGSRGVAGTILAHPEERRYTILVDATVADTAPPFYRFTVAEELAHLTLHREILEQVRTLDDAVRLQESPNYFYLDRNAKWLAGALLMPATHLRSDARALFATLRPRIASEGALNHKLTIRLAQHYGVSPRAMAIRLKNWPLKIYDTIHEAIVAGLSVLPERGSAGL